MKSHIIIILLSFFIINFSQAQSKVRAYINLQKFHSYEHGNYIEVYNLIQGNSVNYIKQNENLIGEVLINYKIYSKDSLCVNFDQKVTSPLVKDSIINDFYDLITIPLNPGVYSLEIVYKDINDKNNQISEIKSTFELKPFDNTNLSFSTIQIADLIQKSKEENLLVKFGQEITPHLGNYFSSECKFLPYYFEIYNPTLDSSLFKLKRKVTDFDNQTIIINDTNYLKLNKINPIINSIDIRNYPTGKYLLEFAVLNIKNQTICSLNYEFDRANNLENYFNIQTQTVLDPSFQKSISSDSLLFYARSLMPIIFSEDQKILIKLIKNQDTTKIRMFMQSFWNLTAKNNNTYETWIKYKTQVQLVEKLYKTVNIHGFETDRGRVYLKYGPPTSVSTRETSPSEYPYEIWQYDKIMKFANKRFVFYNPDIVGSNFRLLHSDLNGEVKNYKWPGLLTKRNNSTINVDDPLEGGFDHFGGESTDVFKQY